MEWVFKSGLSMINCGETEFTSELKHERVSAISIAEYNTI